VFALQWMLLVICEGIEYGRLQLLSSWYVLGLQSELH
jgi:hypothetical protein